MSQPEMPHLSEYDRLLGPFCSTAGARRLLGDMPMRALANRRRDGTVLALRTSDRVWVYPAFQFDEEAGVVREDLVPVLTALAGAPRWGAALWLVTALPELDGRAPLAAASGSSADVERVCLLAETYAKGASA